MGKIIDNAMEEEIYAGVYLLERYARLLLEDKKKEAQGMLPRITELFSVILPVIVQSYEHPDMEAWQQDRQYWVNQLQRIIQSLAIEDVFVQIDVLYCETRENMRSYLQLVNDIQTQKE